MNQLLILSGKGGTGKTTVASAFIKLAHARVYADCDVDAPNLHLVMKQYSEPKKTDYYGMAKAEIDPELCIECDLCRQACCFDAIIVDGEYKIDYYGCEGCGVCEAICPVGAVALKPAVAGELILYRNDTVFSTAQLKMGSGTSGMLVTEVKKQMRSVIMDTDLAIIDGSPGIGCPVIASLSGVDMVLIVAEPSVSGISDMERIIKTAQMFQIKIAVCVNKYDTNLTNTEKIEAFCQQNQLPLAGRIPFDPEAVQAVINGQTIVDMDCAAGRAVQDVFSKTVAVLFRAVFQSLPVDGIIIVTSPQELVSIIVTKAIKMAEMMNIPIIGLVQNMSYFKCPDNDKEYKIFGDSHIEQIAEKHNLKVLAKLPIDPKISEACDKGIIELYDGDWLDLLVKTLEESEEKEMIKIAVASENGMVTEHFGHCLNFNIFEAENNQIVNSKSIANPGHKPGFLPNFLNDQGVNVIISGGMGAGAIDIFNEKGIEVIVGARGDAKNAAQQYLEGILKSTGSVCHEHQHHDECGH